jgi:hypothetical protein
MKEWEEWEEHLLDNSEETDHFSGLGIISSNITDTPKKDLPSLQTNPIVQSPMHSDLNGATRISI